MKRALDRDRAEGQFLFDTNLLDESSKTYLALLIARISMTSNWMYIYILASDQGHLYIGVTNNLIRRVEEHIIKLNSGFTSKKSCSRLVYFEIHDTPGEAIAREKQIKNWRRDKKERLIRSLNPSWIDLAPLLPRSDEDYID